MEPQRDTGLELATLLAQSEAMLAAAAAGDWERVTALEAERRQTLDSLFDGATPRCDRARLTGCLQRVLELDRKLNESARCAQREIGEELERLRTGRRAVQAYQGAPR
jgi:hypothetical protein